VFAAGAIAGAGEAALSLGGEFVDDLESADVGVVASLDPPDAASDDFESESFEPDSFESAPSVPDFP
jgi:hypothetical protein